MVAAELAQPIVAEEAEPTDVLAVPVVEEVVEQLQVEMETRLQHHHPKETMVEMVNQEDLLVEVAVAEQAKLAKTHHLLLEEMAVTVPHLLYLVFLLIMLAAAEVESPAEAMGAGVLVVAEMVQHQALLLKAVLQIPVAEVVAAAGILLAVAAAPAALA
jgi:hypothetical protein